MLSGLLRRALRLVALRLRGGAGTPPRDVLGELIAQANVHARAGRHDLVAAVLERAVVLAPHAGPLWNKLGFALLELGLVDDAIPVLRRGLEHSPADLHARQNLLFALVLRSESPQELLDEHAACAALIERGLPPAAAFSHSWARERLRVGYVSGDFARHAVALFIEPILERHDKGRIEVTCYDNRAAGDAVTERLRTYGAGWRSVAGIDDAALGNLIREDGIDVLVDLSGHTARHRLGAFARRCAPVQVTYLGYPATTGLSAMDYRLTDAVADPPGETDEDYSEKLMRLPGCLWCYRAPYPSVAKLWRAEATITFGSLCNARKLSPHVLRLWAQVLLATPNSKLLLASLAGGLLAQRILGELQGAGVDPKRVECLPWTAPEQFAALHARVDIALDSFPFGGGTTTIEALWHGVPVVTLAGATFPSRGGKTILTHAGEPSLIATSEREFVAIATGLAADRTRLARLRTELPRRLRASAIMDETGFVRGLEDAYRAMMLRARSAR